MKGTRLMTQYREIANCSPLDPIKTVVSGALGTETALCLTIPPEISLFEPDSSADANVLEAHADHERMRKAFENEGIQSINMRVVIGEVLAQTMQPAFETREDFLQELIARARSLHKTYKLVPDFDSLANQIEVLFDRDVSEMGIDAAIAINSVLNNLVDIDGRRRKYDPLSPPAGNFLFWRDTAHVTGDTLALHQMHYRIRQQEVKLAEIGYRALGMEYVPITLPKRASIEGGDILPVELGGQRFALIGSAERTSWDAVVAWYQLHEKSFRQSGDGIVPMVVLGPTENTQNMMHLDTFYQQFAPGAVLHCGEITRHRPIRILMRRGGEIIAVPPEELHTGSLSEWTEHHADHIYDMTRDEQLMYAPNVLVHGSDDGGTTVFVTRDGTDKVTEFLRRHARKVVELCMNQLTMYYGGAHCCTQEFR